MKNNLAGSACLSAEPKSHFTFRYCISISCKFSFGSIDGRMFTEALHCTQQHQMNEKNANLNPSDKFNNNN